MVVFGVPFLGSWFLFFLSSGVKWLIVGWSQAMVLVGGCIIRLCVRCIRLIASLAMSMRIGPYDHCDNLGIGLSVFKKEVVFNMRSSQFVV